MPKLLLEQTVKYFHDKGDLAISKNLLYWGARRGEFPTYKIGNRRVFCTEELEKHFRSAMEKSIKQPEEELVAMGILRRIEG